MGFTTWMAKVNDIFIQRIGLSLEDLEDFDYIGMYDDGLTPMEAYDEVSEQILGQVYDYAHA